MTRIHAILERRLGRPSTAPIVWSRTPDSAGCVPPEKAALRARALLLITASLASGIVGVALSTAPSIASLIAEVGDASGQLSFWPSGAVRYLLAGRAPSR